MEEVFKAAEQGDLEEVMRLVEYTAVNVKDTDRDQNNALYYGVKSGNLQVVSYLANRVGLDPAAGNRYGETPYDLAFRLGFQDILNYFAEKCGFTYENSFHNPIRRGFFPDPSVVRVGEDYFMVNSTFCFFPCIPISHSKDLVNWRIIGYAVTEPEYARLDLLDGGRGYWAPDISYSDGCFYITATLRLNEGMEEKRVQMVTSSERPEGPYEEPAWIHEDGIDPSIFHDADGRKYMLLNRGARILELSRDCRKQISPAKLLWFGDFKRKPEGPHMLRHNGYYYLFLAEGGTGRGHRITVSRSKELMGTYEPCPYNPILYQWDDNAPIQCCGHGKPVQLPDGSWWIVYLCLRKLNGQYGILGRETSMDPLEWTSDGWPVINRGRGPSSQQKFPVISVGHDITGRNASPNEIESEYTSAPLGGYPCWMKKEWMTPRPLSRDQISVKENTLFLAGQGEDLNSLQCRSILVERQKYFDFEAVCQFKVPELSEGESLGLTGYYDENSYLKYGVGYKNGKYGIVFQEYAGDGYINDRFHDVFKGNLKCGGYVLCKMKTEGMKRRFYFDSGEGWIQTDTAEDTKYLSSEGLVKGKRFTGAMAGVYVKGHVSGNFTEWKISETQ
ncbi:family 43 glycosylhydrolase [Clostridium sp. MCC353]|uniref:family 43 glycosylhydrolase n=1 Tax=Clostridium sp. MCC353 TaxID=2592646 RepID=UPI001C0203E4|nr:family 43 glycosylhydrolase [Clostridium sp. MCC353]MBT9777689.1 family 43 glycosylhydrolase [Clostridium sp. MCC353]